jgi:TPR repeat protein
MSLERIVPDASLERGHYHQLATSELDKLDDAEALYERGSRLQNGIDVDMNDEAGWNLILEAAKLGHAIALAESSLEGRGTPKNPKRAVELLRPSAERGHPAGSLLLAS